MQPLSTMYHRILSGVCQEGNRKFFAFFLLFADGHKFHVCGNVVNQPGFGEFYCLPDGVHRRGFVRGAVRFNHWVRNTEEGCAADFVLIEQPAEVVQAAFDQQIAKLGAQGEIPFSARRT